MGTFSLGLLGQLGSLLFATLGGAFHMFKEAVSDAFDVLTEYDQRGIAFARQLGMNAKQAQSYTQVLVARAKELGKAYGISSEKVLELQENLAASTNRAIMLNNEEAEKMIQINKLVGSNVANEFTSEIVNHLGGQLRTVQGAVSKAYATAAKNGLNAAQFSEKVARNLSMANKLSFRDGVNGIIRMTALSEKLGFNLQSVERAAENFMELDKAIEHSAQLQMLGGAAGAYGSNPLLMSYEANYDPEAFTERMTKTLGGYATFDAKTGMANVNGMNKDFVKAIGDAMGIGMEEAMSIAKKQAEITYKESHFGNEIRSRGYSKEQENYIINSSYVGADGKLKMTDMSGREQDVDTLVKNGELDKMMAFEGKTDEEIMRDQALILTSIKEQIEGFKTSFYATLAEPLVANSDIIKDVINDVGHWLTDEIAPKLAEFLNVGIKWIRDNKHLLKDLLHFGEDLITGTLSVIADVATFFQNNWGWLKWVLLAILGAITATRMFNGIMNQGRQLRRNIRSFRRNSRRGSPARARRRNPRGNRVRPQNRRGGARPNGGVNGGGNSRNNRRNRGGTSTATTKGRSRGSASTATTRRRGGASTATTKGRGSASTATTKGRSSTSTATRGRGSTSTATTRGRSRGSARPRGNAIRTPKFRAGGAALLAFGAYDIYNEISDYNEVKKSLNEDLANGQISKKEYDEELKQASNDRNESIGGTVGAMGGAALGAKLGATIGTFIAPGIGTAIGGFLGGIGGSFLGGEGGAWIGKKLNSVIDDVGKTVGAIGSKVKGIFGEVADFITGKEKEEKSLYEQRLELEKSRAEAQARLAKASTDKTLGVFKKFDELLLKTSDEALKGIDERIRQQREGLEKTRTEAKAKIDSGKGNLMTKVAFNLSSQALEKLDEEAKGSYPKFSKGGIIGDNTLVRTNDGEMVLNQTQQHKLFGFINGIKSTLNNTNDVKAKPVGEKEYIYEPRNTNTTNVGGNKITVNDINVKINGTIKLDGGNSVKNIDVSQLLSDNQFISSLKEIIKSSINNDINGGRFMNDTAQMRGLPSQTALWGRKG